MRYVVVALLLACLPVLASAHGGRTDGQGCHHDRKRGGYHCHNGGGARSAPVMPTSDSTENPYTPKPSLAPAQTQTLDRTYDRYLRTPTAPARTRTTETPYTPKSSFIPSSPTRTRTYERYFPAPRDESIPTETKSTFYFLNCREMRQIGKAPMRRGGDGYREALDPNGNGVACEDNEP